MERETYFGSTPEKPVSEGSEAKDKEKKKEKKLSFLDELLEKRKQREAKEREEAEDDSTESKKKEPTKKELAKEFLEHKAEELKDELKSASSIEKKAEIQADLELVEAISDKIDHPHIEVEPAVDEAYQELMAALDEESSEEPEVTHESRPVPIIPLSEVVNDDEEIVDDTAPTSAPPNAPITTNSATPISQPHTTKPTRSPVFTNSAQTHPQPFASASADRGGPLPIETIPKKSVPEVDDRRRVAGKMLVAGALGYVVGRHGGRKRAEAKLQPEIEKRDVAIKDLEKNIESKEYQIRSVASELSRNTHQDSRAESEVSTPVTEQNALHRQAPQQETPPPTFFERPIEPVDEFVQESNKEHFTPPESILTQSESYTPSNEFSELTNTVENNDMPHFSTQTKEQEALIPRLEQLSTPELLNLAEKITVLNTNVRKLYETNQINRQGLEEIVKTHLSGRDIAPVLDRRLLGAEISRERAREFKHDPGGSDDSLDLALSGINRRELKEDADQTAPPRPIQAPEDLTKDTEDEGERPIATTPPPTQVDAHEKTHKTVAVSATIVIALIFALFVAYILLSS